MSRVEKEALTLLKRPIENLISEESSLPKFVTNSHSYKSKKSMYINAYIDEELDDMDSQDVLNRYSQIPACVTDSDIFKKKIEHVTKQNRSEKRI
jgi:hypothetical protein